MATLVSVNVGLPKDVEWRGGTVHTGVWKQAGSGPRVVRGLNIEGDGQGDLEGHGGEYRAVLVYQLASYRYWQEVLGRNDFVHGQFGENFTVDGLADDEVCIGDRFRIGEAEFEVTQPRVTCYRVGLRMNEPRMAALLVSHHRPGFYLRVLVEGRVQAGDEIVKIGSDPVAMSVAEIDGLLYLPGHPRDRLAAALKIPALSPGWKSSLQALLDQASGAGTGTSGNVGLTDAAASPPPAWSGFRSLKVVRVEPESRSVFSLVLADPGGVQLPPALPGQFLTLRLYHRTDAPPLIRSYSLSGRPAAAEYRISVKEEAHGAGSAYLRAHVHAGDALEVAAPRGTFILRGGDTPVLLLSAGVGATPVLAMLHALAAARTTREVWWMHGARDGSEHAFGHEVRTLLAAMPNAHSHVWYSRPATSDRQGQDYDAVGRLSVAGFEPRGAARCRRLPVRAHRLHGAGDRGAGRVRRRPRAHPGGDLRRGAVTDAGSRLAAGARAALAGGRSGHRAVGLLRAQRHHHQLGSAIRESARAGRGVQRADTLVVPDRGVPQLRERAAVGIGDVLARAGRAARRRQPADRLLAAPRRRRPRPVGGSGLLQRPIDERRHGGEHLVAVGLVQDLVARAGIDDRFQSLAGEALDRGPRPGDRDQRVVLSVQPEHRQRSERRSLGARLSRRHQRGQRGALKRPVPDERVVRVRASDLGIPRQRRRIDRDLGDRVHRQQHLDREVAADGRSREDERRQLSTVLLGVARRDEAAHRVADEHERQAGMIGRRAAPDRVEVGDHVVDGLDERALALRPTVPQMIGRVHRGAVAHQMLRDVGIAPRV